MSGERVVGRIDGAKVGPRGPLTSYVGAITPSDATIYDPPLRQIRIGAAGAGNVTLVYAADDESVAANRDTYAVANGQTISGVLIRQVRAATTATGIVGWR